MSRQNINRKGFTLIEVLLALSAMAVAFVALWMLHVSSLKVDSRSNAETAALYYASTRMDGLRATAAQDFNHADLAAGDHNPDPVPARQPFQRRWTVTNTADAWRKNIVVTVSWPEIIKIGNTAKVNRTHSVQLSGVLIDLK